MNGRIHAIQTLGTVDGPGLRMVVFLQGCPLRCFYCHNPESWDFAKGTEMSVEEVVEKVLKYKDYFGDDGGVTLSGGEPTAQAAFATELFTRLHTHGIHTALDTAGPFLNDAVRALLDVTDLVILDIKSTDAAEFHHITGGTLADTEAFLKECVKRHMRIWIRQVIIQNFNDDEAHVDALATFLEGLPIEKVELLGSVPNLEDLQAKLPSPSA
ncbi:MAG: radical SAM protein [Clostridia bacterium]